MKRIFRFVFPFLFTRNWYDGSWELSRPRLIVFCLALSLGMLGIAVAYLLQSPVIYTGT